VRFSKSDLRARDRTALNEMDDARAETTAKSNGPDHHARCDDNLIQFRSHAVSARMLGSIEASVGPLN
jgi:hypothetical protein